jgi:hypothetical protein
MMNLRLALLRLGMSMTPATMPTMKPPMGWKDQPEFIQFNLKVDCDIPRWAKLSRPGNKPRANEINVVIANFDISLQGLIVSRQFNRMSTNMKPISPNNAPEHPIEAIETC